MSVEILLATYNAGGRLGGQLDSIAAQTSGDWTLLARDDGSADDTRDVLRAWCARHPRRARLVEDDRGRLGAAGNYSALLEQATAARVALCDQDDVWLPERLTSTIAAMDGLEARAGADHPALVFSDLRVVDDRLVTRAPSYWRQERLDPAWASDLRRLLVRNVVTGATVLMNAALVRLARPVPREAVMHDWWMALVAAAFGTATAVSMPTVLYRQHPGNRVGARGTAGTLSRVLRRPQRVAEYYARTRQQAGAFRERYDSRLSGGARAVVDAYCALDGVPALRRRARQLRGGFGEGSLTRNLALLLLG